MLGLQRGAEAGEEPAGGHPRRCPTRTSTLRNRHGVDARTSQVPQDATWQSQGHRLARQLGRLWRIRTAVAGAVLAGYQTDRGGAVAITRHMKRRGKVWIRIFPDHSFYKKPV